MSPISAILRNSVQIWISLTRQATTMPEEKKSKSKDDFSYKSRQRSKEVKEYKSQHRNNKMLFNKCNPTIPSVVLPRPAWQEKAHCVAAGSFFIFIIYELFYFFFCRLLISILLFRKSWLPFHLLIISCFPSFV